MRRIGSEMAKDSSVAEHRISFSNFSLACIYIFINVLFVWKYASDRIHYSLILSLIYIVTISIFLFLVLREYRTNLSASVQNRIYFSAVVFLACILTVLMFHFDPGKIAVGRYPAMHDWITRLLHGEFPYASSVNPSGLPFLFILAIPFYILGDLGFLQIFSFLMLAFIAHIESGKSDLFKFRAMLLLIMAPIFLFEIVVRSDLFSNMVIVMLYLVIFRLYNRNVGFIFPLLSGVAGGLLLSTRGVVSIIYIIFFLFMIREHRFKYGLFILSMLAGFIITLAPFLIWNADYFIGSGPFAIQLSYIPGWVFILSIIASVICGLIVRSFEAVYKSITVTLFGVVFVAFTISTMSFGLTESVLGDRFDISYFSFAMPFLLLSLSRSGESNYPKIPER
jgi:hypothetical protein